MSGHIHAADGSEHLSLLGADARAMGKFGLVSLCSVVTVGALGLLAGGSWPRYTATDGSACWRSTWSPTS